MDESFIQIFNEAMLYEDMKESVRRFQITDEAELIPFWNDLTMRLTDFCNTLAKTDKTRAGRIIDSAYKVAEYFYNNALGQGILESELMPLMLDYLSRYKDIEVDDGRWHICGTPSGFVTLRDIESGTYLHSTFDPMWDAYTLADYMYADGMKDFYFFGCGLGYLPYQMWKVSEESVTVHIYDYDPNVVEYAKMFGPLGLIAPDRLDIHVEPDLDSLIDHYLELQSTPYEFYTHPSNWISEQFNKTGRKELTVHLAQYHNHVIARRRYNINVAFNKPYFLRYHMDLPKEMIKDEWIVVAAGPSLDDSIDFIRESIGKRTVVGVSTVIRRLAKENIKPDLFIVCDPFNDIMPHLNGYEDYSSDIPLVAHTQTYWQFIENYRGPIYRIAEAGDEDDIANKFPRWHSGGTVTSLAIELACLSGAKRVYITGMDLAYPGGRYYADGTSKGSKDEAETSLVVRANDGSMVMTAPNFKFYADQVAAQKNHWNGVEFFNLARQGQYIPMTRIGKWWEDGINPDTDLEKWFDDLERDTFLDWAEKYYLLRQTVGHECVSEEIINRKKAEAVLSAICEEMINKHESLRDIHIRKGGTLRVYIVDRHPDRQIMDMMAKDNRTADQNVLVINTNERYAGEKVFFPDAVEQSIEEDVADSIKIYGKIYPYIKMTGRLTDINVYEELLRGIDSQGGASVVSYDPYSLFAALCCRCF